MKQQPPASPSCDGNRNNSMDGNKEIAGVADWRLLLDEAADGAWNMAADEAMLLSHAAGKSGPTLRFYAWSPAAVSLGYFQHADAEIDRAACANRGIDVVRRLTGGRAVLHDAEVTYSLVVRESEAYIPNGVTASYLFFSRGIVAGLARLGINAQMQAPGVAGARSDEKAIRSSVCFDAPSYYELTVGGRKIVGSAQVRKDGILLQHGSILLDFQPERIVNILRLADERTGKILLQELAQRATSLSAVSGKKIGFYEVSTAVAAGMAKECGMNLVKGERTKAETEMARSLAKNKYCAEEWNLRR